MTDNETILTNVDNEKLDKVMRETKANVLYFQTMLTNVITSYTKDLDSLMRDIHRDCVQNEEPSLDTLHAYYLELTNVVYFMQSKVEELGVYADMSENASKEVFSKSCIANNTKTAEGKNTRNKTELEAMATIESQYETVVSNIYDRAYKIAKNKLSSAQDMMNCLRKIITSRGDMMKLDAYAPREQLPGDRDD